MTKPLTKSTVIIMSIAAGVGVANAYYAQSMLREIAEFCGVSESEAGIIPVLSVAGYGAGLFFLTPLGDRLDRKKLILTTQALLAVTLIGMFLSTDFWQICALSFITGGLSINAQLLIPMAVALDPAKKSRNISMIVTGLLMGIVGARAFSGYVTMHLGWQCVYAFSAALVLITSGLLDLMLPHTKKNFDGSYGDLLRSAVWQIKRFPQLRSRALLGALIFATFCSFWTTLTLHLGGDPFRLQADTIGLFSFIGIAGALTTLVFGKVLNADNITRFRTVTVSLIVGAALLLLLLPYSLYTRIVVVLLLDMGVQTTQLTNLSTIYQLDEKAHSRVNTLYMTTCFVGGMLGTLTGLACWNLGGWDLVILQLLALSLAAMTTAAFISTKERPSLQMHTSQNN
jgi:predicted MFS family arabinose efflux permease